MLSSVTTIRNLFILLAALVLATGCTTAKTLGTPVSAVAATPAPSSDSGTAATAEATTDTGTTGAVKAAAPKPWMMKQWVVGEGEHLWGISGHNMVYGDPYQWPLLFKRNRHQIEDADLIYPGQVLHIERDLSNAEIDRAIEHAKTRGAWILGITELTDLEYLSRERGYE